MASSRNIVSHVSSNVILRNVILAVCAVIVFVVLVSVLLNFFTRHGDYHDVPDFHGMTMEQAREAARKGELALEINDSLFVPGYDGGVILDQMPAGGTQVKSGRRILITVNSYSQKMVRIPYVTDLSLRQAKNNLLVAGLEIDRIIYREYMATNYVLEERYRNEVIAPNSMLEAEQGSGVTLFVGLDPGEPTPAMPKVIGLTLSEAKNRLWESGLNVGKIMMDENISLVNRNEARVYMQSPGQGYRVAYGTDVELRFTLDDNRVDAASAESDKNVRQILESENMPEEYPENETEN